jgi:hypothetical protein
MTFTRITIDPAVCIDIDEALSDVAVKHSWLHSSRSTRSFPRKRESGASNTTPALSGHLRMTASLARA